MCAYSICTPLSAPALATSLQSQAVVPPPPQAACGRDEVFVGVIGAGSRSALVVRVPGILIGMVPPGGHWAYSQTPI